MDIKELLGYSKGDIMTLSDLQTIATFKATDGVDFEIEEVRIYHEPGDLFTYTGYISKASDDRKYMLLIRQIDDVADLSIFYLDQEGDAFDFHDAIIDEDGEDFEQNFEVEIDDKDVTWIQKSSPVFGVEVEVDGEEGLPLTLCEFGTNSEINNPIAFLEWSGEEEDQWLEVWYGCQIKEYEASILSME